MSTPVDDVGKDAAPRAGLAAKLEVLLPLSLVALHGMYYNLTGAIAGSRGVDLGPLVATPPDAFVPYVPVFSLAYLPTWPYPVRAFVRAGVGTTR